MHSDMFYFCQINPKTTSFHWKIKAYLVVSKWYHFAQTKSQDFNPNLHCFNQILKSQITRIITSVALPNRKADLIVNPSTWILPNGTNARLRFVYAYSSSWSYMLPTNRDNPGGGPPRSKKIFFLVIIFLIFVVRPPSKTLSPFFFHNKPN